MLIKELNVERTDGDNKINRAVAHKINYMITGNEPITPSASVQERAKEIWTRYVVNALGPKDKPIIDSEMVISAMLELAGASGNGMQEEVERLREALTDITEVSGPVGIFDWENQFDMVQKIARKALTK